VLLRDFSFLFCLHSLRFLSLLSLRQVAAALPISLLLFLKRKAKMPQHATRNPHRWRRMCCRRRRGCKCARGRGRLYITDEDTACASCHDTITSRARTSRRSHRRCR
jgi:hypothetical protein